jgi:hypothetical protein
VKHAMAVRYSAENAKELGQGCRCPNHLAAVPGLDSGVHEMEKPRPE